MTTGGDVRLHLDLERRVGRRDPLLLGYFVEHFHRQIYGGIVDPDSPLSDEHGFRTDVIEAMRRLRPATLRWPGGCFVSAYHWKDGVGPDRQPAFDKAWGVEEPNAFGTDEFVALCRLVDTAPYICTNAGTGTPEEMADWLEYCNLADAGRWAGLRRRNGHERPHDVRLWSIGNENYGAWEIGAHEPREWASYVTEAAKMMKLVDPSVRLAVASTADLDWNLPLLRKAGSYLDYVAIHAYAAAQDSTYEDCVAASELPEQLITRTEAILRTLELEGRLRIAFDEWNPRGWAGGLPGAPIADRDLNDVNATYTMADAVVHACFLNACLRHCDTVALTSFSPIVNTRGAIFTHDTGIVLRSTFHVCELYAAHLLEDVLEAHCRAPELTVGGKTLPACDVAATAAPSGTRVAAAVTNRHPSKGMTVALALHRGSIGSAHIRTVNGSSVTAYNDVDRPDDVTVTRREVRAAGGDCKVEIEPHSVNVIELEVAP